MNQIGVPADNLALARVGHGYIELRNRRFVAVYKITGGINAMIDEPGTIYPKVNAFENAIRQLRANEEIQIILKRSTADEKELIKNFNSTVSDKAPEGYKSSYNGYFVNYISDFIKGNRLCQYEAYVLFSIDFNLKPLTEQAVGLFTKLFVKNVDKPQTTEELLKQLEEVRRRANAWMSVLGVAGVRTYELTEDEIYKLLYSDINLTEFSGKTDSFKRTAPLSAGADGMETLREALCTQPVVFAPNFVRVGETYLRTMSVTNFPDVRQQPLFVSQFLFQKEIFRVCVFIRGIDQDYGKSVIRSQMRIDQAAGDDGSTPNYDAMANLTERNSVLTSIARKETGLGRVSLLVSVYGNSEKELKNNYENFTSRFEGIHRYDGFFQQEELYYSSLPFCSNRVQGRAERLQTTTDIANVWPFFYDNLTADRGVLLGYTAGSEPLQLNPWSTTAENYNIGVFGSPGSGKSFLMQIILNRLMPRGPEVMIIDRSGCYATTCQAAGGEYIYFDLQCKKHINPFDCPEESYLTRGIVSEDQEEAVLGYLTTILTETGEKNLKNAENAVLLEAIKRTYKNKYDSIKGKPIGDLEAATPDDKTDPLFPLLRDFRDALLKMSKEKDRSESSRDICGTFADILPQFVEDGTYANITDRPTNIDRNSSFIVFDTSLAAKREKIKALVTYVVSTYCFARARKCQKAGKFPVIVIDEFWDLLSFPAGQDFADILSRTSRHLSLCTIYATQKIADCMASEKAKTALDNAATKVFLKLGDADRALCVQAFELGPKEAGIISGLHQVKGAYSQAFIKSTARQGLAFICPDDVTYWISTSHPLDKPKREKYQKHYNPDNSAEGCWKAVYHLVEDEFFGRNPEFLRS